MSKKILNDKEQKMETKEQILEEVNAFLDAVEKARNDYYSKAVRIASRVAKNGSTIAKCEIDKDIRAFIDADTRYTKALLEATAAAARARLSRFLNGGRKGGKE